MKIHSYDAIWDQQLQQTYKVGIRGSQTNRETRPVAVPPTEAFVRLPAEGNEDQGLRVHGEQLLKAGKLGVLHLNGGLGTRFGRMKAACEVAEFSGRKRTFLELKIAHVLWVAQKYGGNVAYGLMNSPMTDAITQEFLGQNQYFGLQQDQIFSYVQSVLRRKIPRQEEIKATFLTGKELQKNLDFINGKEGEFFPSSEKDVQWAPAGHFDAVAALILTRTIGKYLDAGVEYLQISNVDNLAATVDPAILGVLAKGPSDLLVEVAMKKPGDRGGVPVLWDNKGVVLMEEFALPAGFDAERVRPFNTATYWVKLSRLLDIFGLTYEDIKNKPEDVLTQAVRALRAKIPTYTVLKKATVKGLGEVLAVQDEQLLGDITKLYLESTGKSASYLLIDTEKRFIPIKTREDLASEASRVRRVLQDQVLFR